MIDGLAVAAAGCKETSRLWCKQHVCGVMLTRVGPRERAREREMQRSTIVWKNEVCVVKEIVCGYPNMACVTYA
jgi:hypothetical protein